MLRLLLSGCHGRMGRQLVQYCRGRTDAAVAAGIDPQGRPGDGFPVFRSLAACSAGADVLVDFSRPEALESVLAGCLDRAMPAVLAVTGYSPAQEDAIRAAAERIPILRAANLSVGAYALQRLSIQARGLLAGYDAAVIERHRRGKLDAPSGTALLLTGALGCPVCSVRAGTVAGEHTVLFAGEHEVLEFTHRADSGAVFAAGALRAARFLAGRAPGLYGMDDLLNRAPDPLPD